MKHDGFLIAIFLIVALVIPVIIVMRMYGTVFSGLRKSDSKNSAAGENAIGPEQEQEPVKKIPDHPET
jgi:hypothetical protein